MRTTLTLNPDVATQIERIRRLENESLKKVVNRLLRRALQSDPDSPTKYAPVRTTPIDLGRCLIGVDDVSEALAIGEGDAFR